MRPRPDNDLKTELNFSVNDSNTASTYIFWGSARKNRKMGTLQHRQGILAQKFPVTKQGL
jgi:hypothetical protein